jgi:hypothetical protein
MAYRSLRKRHMVSLQILTLHKIKGGAEMPHHLTGEQHEN